MKRVVYFLLVVFFGIFVSCSSSPPAIIKAAREGNLERVIQLVEKGADINERYYGNTALERAASNGHFEIVQYLLSLNANDPQRAFERALRGKHYNIAKFIVDGGYININYNAHYFYIIFNDTQISFEQKLQIIKEISGDKLNSPYLLALVDAENYQYVIDYFNIDLEAKTDVLGNSILHVGAMRNNLDLLTYLLENYFDVNVLDNNNHTALFYCITSFGPSINWDNPIIEDETTARINYTSDMPYYGDPDRVNSIRTRQAQISWLLLDNGININQQNNSGWTVLHFACASYPAGPYRTFIERGADQNIKTNFGRTAADILALRM